MNEITKRGIITAILLVVTLACVISTTTLVSYAVWQRKVSADKEIEIPVGDYNQSLKYLKFRGLNAEMNFASTNITQYAVVGFDGIVAEIIIPEVYTVNGVDYPVVMATTDPEHTEYGFANNQFVTSIVIPASVVKITSSTFSGMTSLLKVNILGEAAGSSIQVDDYAFAGCVNLTVFNCARTVVGVRYNYLWGTPLI